MSVLIERAEPGKKAALHGIKDGFRLISVNGHEINDVLDYRFYTADSPLRLAYEDGKGTFFVTRILKEEGEDLGLRFSSYLMDKQRRCRNSCIFCFIDQLPCGLRKSLYFKDDDLRLSFFYGNYITLTNLERRDIDRIKAMHLSPVNVSVHTMNPKLRCRMMRNARAGESLAYLKELADFGTAINVQLVLCPGINDGEELKSTLHELSLLCPAVQSIAAVPVGLTKHRQGLYELSAFSQREALDVIEIIEDRAALFEKKFGSKICYASDEFYLKAGLSMPSESSYGGYPQLSNGVGMWRLFESEALREIETLRKRLSTQTPAKKGKSGSSGCKMSIATGKAAYPLIKRLACESEKLYSTENAENTDGEPVAIKVFEIENSFFGDEITVSGLIVGRDLLSQLSGKDLGKALLLPENMFRAELRDDEGGSESSCSEKKDPDGSEKDRLFLDDMTSGALSRLLGVPVIAVPLSGCDFIRKIGEVLGWQDR